MTDGAAVPTQGPVTRSSVVRVGAATVVSALCGYAVLYLAARDLAPAGFSVFAVFWGAFGLLAGAANGLLQESTREVRQASRTPPSDGPRDSPDAGGRAGRRRVRGGGRGECPAVVRSRLRRVARWLSVGLLSAGIAGFCMHATLLGVLAGVNGWSQYGALIVGDAIGRVAVATATFLLGWGLVGLPVGDRGRVDRVAGAPAGLADDAGRGAPAHAQAP